MVDVRVVEAMVAAVAPAVPDRPPDQQSERQQDGLRSAAEEYRERYGWSIELIDSQVMLALGHGVVGMSMPPAHGGEVNSALERHGLTYPVLWLPLPRNRWVFLAAHTGPLPHVPYFAALLSSVRIPLPPSPSASGQLSWVEAPERCASGLPALDPLLVMTQRHH